MLVNRPLTTLLLAATICVDVVVWTAARKADTDSMIALAGVSLFLSQMGLLSIWLAMGKTIWRLRFATWISGIVIVSLASWPPKPMTPEHVVEAFPMVSIFAVVAWCMSIVGTAVFKVEQRLAADRLAGRPRRQFSMAQLLCWMTFVAIVAAAVRRSDVRGLFDVRFGIELTSMAAISVAAVVLLWGRLQKWFRFACLLACSSAMGSGIALIYGFDPSLDIGLTFVSLALYLIYAAVTGIWVCIADYDTRCNLETCVASVNLISETANRQGIK